VQTAIALLFVLAVGKAVADPFKAFPLFALLSHAAPAETVLRSRRNRGRPACVCLFLSRLERHSGRAASAWPDQKQSVRCRFGSKTSPGVFRTVAGYWPISAMGVG
jgi:hypothetical protein